MHAGTVDPEELRRLSSNRNVLSALVEACLGALYLQHGFEPIREPIVEAFQDRIEYALEEHVDFKTELQEELARRGLSVSYSVLEVEGAPHERRFTCAANIEGEEVGVGVGDTKGGEQAGPRGPREARLGEAVGSTTSRSRSARRCPSTRAIRASRWRRCNRSPRAPRPT